MDVFFETRQLLSTDETLSLSWADGFAVLLIILFGAVAAGGGLGGGGIYVSVLLLVSSKPHEYAVPLAQATVVGAVLTNVIVFFRQSHPLNESLPLIDTDTILVLSPPLLLGSLFGVMLNRVIPSFIIVLLLVVLLTYTSYSLFRKGKKRWIAEKMEAVPVASYDNLPDENIRDGEVRVVTSPNRVRYNRRTFVLPVIWFSFLGIVVTEKLVEMCSVPFWIIVCVSVPLSVTLTLVISKLIPKSSQSFDILPGSTDDLDNAAHERIMKWRKRDIARLSPLCVIIGVLTAMLGLGGATFVSPLLHELRIPPDVCAATSSGVTLMASLTVCIAYSMVGRLPVLSGLMFFCIGCIAGGIGRAVVGTIVRRTNRRSIITILVATALITAGILLAFALISSGMEQDDVGAMFKFGDVCETK